LAQTFEKIENDDIEKINEKQQCMLLSRILQNRYYKLIFLFFFLKISMNDEIFIPHCSGIFFRVWFHILYVTSYWVTFFWI